MRINTYSGYCDDEQEWWLPDRITGGAFHIDVNEKSEFLGLFLDPENKVNSDVVKVFSKGDDVFFFSKYKYLVWVYSKSEKNMKCIEYCNAKTELITNVEVVNDVAWVFSNNFSSPIVSVELVNMSNIRTVECCEDKALGEGSITRTVLYENSIFFMNRVKNNIYCFELDCLTHTVNMKLIPPISIINCLAVDDKNIYCLYINDNNKTCIGIINRENYELEEIDITQYLSLTDDRSFKYFRMLLVSDTLLMIPWDDVNLVTFDLINRNILIHKGNLNIENNINSNRIILNDSQKVGEDVLLYSPVLGSVLNYSFSNGVLSEKNLDIDVDTFNSCIREVLKCSMIHENETINLSKMIEVI